MRSRCPPHTETQVESKTRKLGQFAWYSSPRSGWEHLHPLQVPPPLNCLWQHLCTIYSANRCNHVSLAERAQNEVNGQRNDNWQYVCNAVKQYV